MRRRWLTIGAVSGLILAVLGIGATVGALAFKGGSSGTTSLRVETTSTPTPSSSTATIRPAALPSVTGSPVTQNVATNVPLVTPQIIVAQQPIQQTTSAAIAPTQAPAATNGSQETAAPTLAPTATPAPTPRPTPAITWPEVAQGFANQENAYYDTIKTPTSFTLPGLGTVTGTSQYHLSACQVESWNNADWAWVIRCDVGFLQTYDPIYVSGLGWITPPPQIAPNGAGLFKLFADTGNVIQL